MKKAPYDPAKALKAVNISQMIEGYKPTENQEVKDQVKKILANQSILCGSKNRKPD